MPFDIRQARLGNSSGVNNIFNCYCIVITCCAWCYRGHAAHGPQRGISCRGAAGGVSAVVAENKKKVSFSKKLKKFQKYY